MEYNIENNLDLQEFSQVLMDSPLAERRPIDEPQRLQKMLEFGNLIVTARYHGKLVGVARSLTDYSFCTYLSDLAVAKDFQRQGIGRELIRRTKRATPEAKLILLAAPNSLKYYPKIGLKKWEHCYVLDDINHLMK
jgi:GNAT superfamily N-acetyltransferase